MFVSRRSRCVLFGFASMAVYTTSWWSGESPLTAKTTGTRCGFPSGELVASRATGDCVNRTFGSNSPTLPA
jgi:hypothetical protein